MKPDHDTTRGGYRCERCRIDSEENSPCLNNYYTYETMKEHIGAISVVVLIALLLFGELWYISLRDVDRVPNKIYGIIALCFSCCLCCVFCSGILLLYLRKRAEEFEKNIRQRHTFYNDDLVPFLAAVRYERLRNEGSALDAFVCDPLYDGKNIPKLIGQFIDVDIKFSSDKPAVTTSPDFICKIDDGRESHGAYEKSDSAGNFFRD